MLRLYVILIGVLMTCGCPSQATTYASARLRTIAYRLELPGLDTLPAGEYTHYTYRSHPLSVRINEWNEVEHIGLELFAEQQKQDEACVVYDFIERYLLECDLLKGTEAMVRLDWDQVHFIQGDAETVFDLTGEEKFVLSRLDKKAYTVEWYAGGHPKLAFSFEMDYQLMSGCSLIELEQFYLCKLDRFRAHPKVDILDIGLFPDSATYYVKGGDHFIIDKVRNDCYYRKEGGEWHLIIDTEHPSHSIANIVQNSGVAVGYWLDLTLDRYGYRSSRDTVGFANWLECCKSEGCHPYFGMKQKRGSNYEGTVFMVNEANGYLHMLSIVFPTDVLRRQGGMIEGRLFVYIPIHNVTEQFFDNTYYKQIDDETTNTSDAMDNSIGYLCTAKR
jgi:hypothetical protein